MHFGFFPRIDKYIDGFKVIEAIKGHEALDKMRTDMPDMILLDVMRLLVLELMN